jgi:hypothetical protein
MKKEWERVSSRDQVSWPGFHLYRKIRVKSHWAILIFVWCFGKNWTDRMSNTQMKWCNLMESDDSNVFFSMKNFSCLIQPYKKNLNYIWL